MSSIRFALQALSLTLILTSACGEKDTSESKAIAVSAADKDFGVVSRTAKAGGMVTVLEGESTAAEANGDGKHAIWSDDNVLTNPEAAVGAVCEAGQVLATDSMGRAWGYESDESCIVL